MAILGSNFLSGCGSIPNFIATGSRMVFEQTNAPGHNPPAAPTSWTKETNAAFNDVALRVVTGPAGSGGGLPFISVFPNSPKGLSGVPLAGPSNLQVEASGPILALQPSPAAVSMTATPLSTPQMISHTHPYQQRATGQNPNAAGQLSTRTADATTNQTPIPSSSSYGGGIGHAHGIQDQGHAGHPVNPGSHGHGVNPVNHTHQFSMTARDFRLLYMDVIICTKN